MKLLTYPKVTFDQVEVTYRDPETFTVLNRLYIEGAHRWNTIDVLLEISDQLEVGVWYDTWSDDNWELSQLILIDTRPFNLTTESALIGTIHYNNAVQKS